MMELELSLRMDSNNNINNNGVNKEHMFEKVVTPSDVGKLNRLVIPKQHAEKYFPALDSTTNEKGLTLNFHDSNGNPWRFRYSYWNSSQSYVITKGWSRFVKHNKLHAGDVVSFLRALPNVHRLFIDCHHRRLPRPLFFRFPNYALQSPRDSFISSSSMGVKKDGSVKRRLRLFGVNMECGAANGEEQELSNKRGKEPLSFNWDLL